MSIWISINVAEELDPCTRDGSAMCAIMTSSTAYNDDSSLEHLNLVKIVTGQFHANMSIFNQPYMHYLKMKLYSTSEAICPVAKLC